MLQLAMACRKAGLPVTSQRLVIMAALASRLDHPTADDIFEVVKETLPGISRTTVYRVLDLLVRLGVAVRIHSPAARSRFDADIRRHHHAVCQVCERVVDLPAPAFDGISIPDGKAAAFTVSGYSVKFIGACLACAVN